MKHGVLAIRHTSYEKDIYKDYLKELCDEYKPITFTEKLLVERAALCYLRLFRCARAEWEQIQAELNPRVTKDIFPTLIEIEEVVEEGYSLQLSAYRLERIEQTIFRYERHTEKTLLRTVRELERRKASREGERIQPPVSIDVDVSKEG